MTTKTQDGSLARVGVTYRVRYGSDSFRTVTVVAVLAESGEVLTQTDGVLGQRIRKCADLI
jgi:hypothetical protein